MLTCSTEHRGSEDTNLRQNLQGPWGERVQERHPPMHKELVELHSDNHCPLHNTQPHEQSIPVAALLSMVPFQVWSSKDEGVGLPQEMGPNKSTEREAERRKEFGAQDKMCYRVMVAPSRPPPPPPFPLLGEEDPARVCVCTQTQGE